MPSDRNSKHPCIAHDGRAMANGGILTGRVDRYVDPVTGQVAGEVQARRGAKSRHSPPSRARYAAQHPSIGVHVDKPTYQKLLELRERSGLSLGQLVRQALKVVENDVEMVLLTGRGQGYLQGFEEGRARGYDQALQRYCLTYPCDVCHKALEIKVGSESARAAVEALADQRWGHADCHKRVAR